jgi:hypothetical protein
LLKKKRKKDTDSLAVGQVFKKCQHGLRKTTTNCLDIAWLLKSFPRNCKLFLCLKQVHYKTFSGIYDNTSARSACFIGIPCAIDDRLWTQTWRALFDDMYVGMIYVISELTRRD